MMKRLTTDKNALEMGMVELAHNSCYAKDGEAWYRDYERDISARQMGIQLLDKFADVPNEFTCDEDFDKFMLNSLQYGTKSILGLIAVFYQKLWAMAGLRERLKYYEDLEEQGRLIRLPCAVGDTVYTLNPLPSGKTVVAELEADAFFCALSAIEGRFGKTVFPTREEAGKALEEAKRCWGLQENVMAEYCRRAVSTYRGQICRCPDANSSKINLHSRSMMRWTQEREGSFEHSRANPGYGSCA
ncbi:MAG: hypothetical protein NC548_39655 [Lachnospiraceae bacterium]|nr:hypothetical protein [Lachnospiraceae bacterium]